MRMHNSFLGLVVIGLASENTPGVAAIRASNPHHAGANQQEGVGEGGAHPSLSLGERKAPRNGIDNSAMLEAVSRSIFDLLSLPHHRPLLDMGVLLALQGFVFGIEVRYI